MEKLDTVYPVIHQHYVENYKRLIKSTTWRADTEWAAQDCVQEAYYRCMKYWNTYNPNIEFGRWFSMILSNCVYEYKNEERGHFAEEFWEETTEGTPCGSHVQHIFWGIDKLIDAKPEHMKEILEYHFQQGYSALDISRITEHTYANVHKVISRFREELREIYGT
jgi:RNA polymerase sigma factor (sigma-70 family)